MKLKKHLILPATLLAVLLPSCQSGGKGEISIKIPDSIVESSHTHLYFMDVALDKAVDSLPLPADIEGQDYRMLNYAYNSDSLRLMKCRLGKHSFSFFTEATSLSATLDSSVCATGSSMNNEFGSIAKEIIDRTRQAKNEIAEIANKGGILQEELISLKEKIAEHLEKDLQIIYRQNIDKHLNDLLGAVLVYQGSRVLPSEEIKSYIERAGEKIKEYPLIRSWLERASREEATGVGHTYVDVEGAYIDKPDQTAKLSDLLAVGQYTIVDFWASWCGPCRQEVVKLKALSEKYGAKGLKIAGVAIWDKPEDTKLAIEKLGITWPVMLEKERGTIGDMYGIEGIPTLLLIDANGKILARGHESEPIAEMLEEIYKDK
ncbi:thiol:disulfide interchange protein [Porphyromonas crevioricanis JCM 15906]|uniref:Thiol:disulfide interchange protein n=1 Tax=Porphyromonas crevioricanis JCM 15906 TaxID=1305617 RepID=T1CN33_9PORP|nr:TlpA disulfide reductase family protein [Porphyromonas crevioricanis]GAD05197.1 thiol:disulfide interchange protein [Porphyromonas crevioricanis JCM 15906]SJZ99782.1 Thiol-disulfide isomerase or thioredoxin [Porphyromonas crevioricanis]